MFDNNRPDAIDTVRHGRRTHQLGSSQPQTHAHRDNGGWYMVTQDWCAANVLILLPRSPVIGNRANCHSCGLVHLPTSCCCCCIYLHELTNKMCHAFGWSFAVTGVRAVRLSANMQMSMTKRTQSNITGLPDAYYTAACRLLFATALCCCCCTNRHSNTTQKRKQRLHNIRNKTHNIWNHVSERICNGYKTTNTYITQLKYRRSLQTKASVLRFFFFKEQYT